MQDQEWRLEELQHWLDFLVKNFHHNHWNPSITGKRRHKTKHLTWISIIIKFVKNTSMPNLVKSLGYIKHYSSSNPRPVKSPSSSTRYYCQNICSWSEELKLYWRSEKSSHFSRWSTTLSFTSFWKSFINHRKKTNKTVVCSCRPFPNILKYWDHQWNLPTIWKTRLL